MNILIPVHYFTDDPQSGLHTELWNFPKHLAELGHNVFVITTSLELKRETKKSLRKKNIYIYKIYNYKTHGLGYGESLMVFIFFIFLRILHKFDWIFIIDSVHTPFVHFKLGARVASRVFFPDTDEYKQLFNSGEWLYDRKHKDEGEGWEERKIPLMYRLFRFVAIKIWYRLFPVKYVGENADILFCQGKEPLNYYRSIRGLNPVYLPNGMESSRFNYDHDLINKQGKFVYLFIGRILKCKGIFYLVDVFKEMSKKYPDIKLWIVGASYSHYDELLMESIKGFEGRVKLLGPKDNTEIPKYIRSCDVVVDPFVYASFSNVILEALYCKKPVIAPLLGDTKDFVQEGITGFLVDSRNKQNLKAKMEYCYNNYEEVKKMGEIGYEFVSTYLTWKNVIKIVDDNLRFFDDKKKISELNKKYENFEY